VLVDVIVDLVFRVDGEEEQLAFAARSEVEDLLAL
jgi:hypothetical protein